MERGEMDRTLATLQDSAALMATAGADGAAVTEARFARILEGIVRHVPGADYAGVTTIGSDTSTVCHSPDDPGVVRELEDIQWGLGEGPCVVPFRARRNGPLVVGDLAAESTHWPRYCAVATRWGVRSVLAFLSYPLEVTAGTEVPSGVVTVYSRSPHTFVELSRTIGALFAMQVTIVLYGARQFGRLIETMEAGEVVGRATGILMERFGLDRTQAHQMLISTAEDSNTPLVEMATWLTAQGKEPWRRTEPGSFRNQI